MTKQQSKRGGVKKKKEVDSHTLICDICRQMAQRGYRDESKYFDDFFCDKLKPIKYKLVPIIKKARANAQIKRK